MEHELITNMLNAEQFREDIFKEDSICLELLKNKIYNISCRKGIVNGDFDYFYSESVKIIKSQIQKSHLNGIMRFNQFEKVEDCINWTMARIINNIKNISRNNKYSLFINPQIINFIEFEIESHNDDFNEMLVNRDLAKIDKLTLQNGLKKIYDDVLNYDEDFDLLDFEELCLQFNFKPIQVLGFDPIESIHLAGEVDKYGYFQLCLNLEGDQL